MDHDSTSATTGSESDARWYAVCTAPRHEKRVNELMSDMNIETYLPLYEARRQWKKRPPVVLELPLFPSYVFVRIHSVSRAQVLRTPGVLSFVGNGRNSVTVADSEIDALRRSIEKYGAEPHPYFAIGEKVRIKSGPLSGFAGTLVRNKSSVRVVITIEAIMQGISVEVDLTDLELPHAPDPSPSTSRASLIM